MLTHRLLENIEKRCVSPFYIMYPDRFKQNIKSFSDAFLSRYENFQISYSFKTNYTPPLLTLAKELNVFAETVSQMEYEMACKLGYKGDRIIFNGPVKKICDIEKAILNGSIVNLDGEYETDFVERIKSKHPDKEIKVGLRINMEINTDSGKSAIQSGLKESRFGHTIESLSRVIPRLKNANIKIVSLHGHVSSTNRVVDNYILIAKKLLDIRSTFELNEILYFDLGGGFFGATPKEISIVNKPTYDDYAEGICNILLQDNWFRKNKPFIIIEPGTSVVCNVFELVTKVYQRKQVGGKNFVIVDASRALVRPALGNTNYYFEIVSDKALEPTIVTDIVGSTCMEVDVVADAVQMNHYSYGDYLIFKGLGAYRNNMLPFFINARPAIVSIIEDGFEIIRERQTSNEMLNLLGYSL